MIKSNLQPVLNISIRIERNSQNTSIITIEEKRDDSDDSGTNKMSPHTYSLSPYLDGISPESNEMTPIKNHNSSIKSDKAGDIGDTGDRSEEVVLQCTSSNNLDGNQKIDELLSSQPNIGYKNPFYYCKQHPKVQNIHFDEIKRHLELSKDHSIRQKNMT